ncbi:predicted protein [Naegleria gruberi]|uniref:Predicted protein n=1 Tax=Naegleria gruberi TaxID=5762 RepID=D2VFP9_NAEGR|nr:uncharacterized protein NAEGRDRAFT_67701 [Naegleria gruberi]EFC44509.1 predicted protein [Naegleria gruberi]|eukprot:XP_002677253.1 predicted protein [Naegleria gruberi strain NEG-M]
MSSLLSSSLKQQNMQQLSQSLKQQQQFMEEQRFKNNPFFEKLFKRIDGLVSILVADSDGNIISRGYSEECQIEFDTTFPATHILAAEQANKLPFGKNKYIISCYNDYSILQMYTESANTGDEKKSEEEDDDEMGEFLYISFICTSDASLQLIIDLSDSIMESMKTLYLSQENEQQ